MTRRPTSASLWGRQSCLQPAFSRLSAPSDIALWGRRFRLPTPACLLLAAAAAAPSDITLWGRRFRLPTLACLLLAAATAAAPSDITFTDVTAPAGIHFTHNAGRAGKRYLPETLGAGCAFFDFDGDGWPDILLINSLISAAVILLINSTVRP